MTLHELRQHRGLSQAELAARLQVSQPAVSAWETMKKRPKWQTAARIAEALDAVPVPPETAAGPIQYTPREPGQKDIGQI